MTPTSIDTCTYDTPVGPLNVLALADEDRPGGPVVLAAGFCPPTDLVDRIPWADHDDLRATDHLGSLHQPIVRFLDGELEAMDEIPVDQPGTEFQQEVWNQLRAIPAGETRTYTQLAEAAGRPRAVRAVGSACGRNLVAPFVPCHRALRSDGSLGGYYYGLDVKRWLLAHEGKPTG